MSGYSEAEAFYRGVDQGKKEGLQSHIDDVARLRARKAELVEALSAVDYYFGPLKETEILSEIGCRVLTKVAEALATQDAEPASE